MVDLNIDVGEFIKKIFSKKKESKEGVSTATSEKIQSKTALLIGGAVGILLIVCFIYFFIFRPQLNEQRKMMEKKNNYEKELVQLQSQLKKREQYFEEINKKFSGKMRLFHTDAEVEGLYETISNVALKYKLTISKLERDKEIPVYKSSNNQTNNNQKKESKQINYYKILVKYQLIGNYMRYMNFKESFAQMDKTVYFEKEEIKVMPKKKGFITADGVLSVIRLP